MILTKSEIYFSIESGTKTVLLVWKNRLHCKADKDNTLGIFMRLDRYQEYSVPLNKETINYIYDPNRTLPVLKSILELGEFSWPIEKEKEIIKLLSKLKIVTRNYEW